MSEPNFPDQLMSRVAVKLRGKEYPLKRFTFGQEIRLKQVAGGDMQKWQKEFQQLDPECMINTLFLFMEPNQDYPNTQALGEALDCTLEQKMAIMNAITSCITAAMPEIQDALKKNTDKACREFREMVMSQLTGPGSSTNSSQPTDGEQATSSN